MDLSPVELAHHYSRFRVTERVLLSGHSHQAWPDRGFDAQQQAWLDAAEHVDDKWSHAFARSARVQRGILELLGDATGEVSLGASTFDLLTRWFSALPLAERPVLVTTDGEFHSLSRVLRRMEEEGTTVVRVASLPAADVGERLADKVDDRTAAVLVSAVFFGSGQVAGGLRAVAEAAQRHGAELLVDAYHALGALPFRLADQGLERACVVGGGYKYLQLGEGCCFLRYPADCQLRPVYTGWFSDFAGLADVQERIRYGPDGGRFAGATYDPVSHYRAAAVMDFFAEQGMSPQALRATSQRQLARLQEGIGALGIDPRLLDWDRDVPIGRRGGFLALRSPRAGELVAELKARGVHSDHRGDVLRLGPAPYVTDEQLDAAAAALGEATRS